MWLLLCDRRDTSALWAYQGLRARGLALELVGTEALAYALGWEYRLGCEGSTIRIQLGDGRTIEDGDVCGVLNRIAALPEALTARARPADRQYALQELQAFWLSWLSDLECPVLNRPSPQGLAGPWLDRSEWLVLAARAGLATNSYRSAEDRQSRPSSRSALVVAGHPVAAVPAMVVAGCRELSKLAGVDLLGVEFTTDGSWRFVDATPYPDLSLGGEQGLELIAATLRGETVR